MAGATQTKELSAVGYLLRHGIPLFVIKVLLDLLPDYRATMRLRGRAISPFLGSCGPGLEVGRDVTLLGADHLHIGRDVYLAKGSWLNAGGGLTIGDEVMFGPYVVVSTSSHVFRGGSARFAGWRLGSVRIGRGSWIAAHCTVTRGVSIGEGNLVAANTAVTRDTPDHVLVMGVPGEVVGPVAEHEAEAFGRDDL
jgi:acetyltransferase-like isoleucine patch superfamily enzyme